MKAKKQILILGIGNTIRGDDGVGIYLARKLRGILPRRFEIRESAAGGFDLLEAIYGYDKVTVASDFHKLIISLLNSLVQTHGRASLQACVCYGKY